MAFLLSTIFFCITDVPGQPTGPIEILEVRQERAKFAWKPPKDNGGSEIKSYIIERRDAGRSMWMKVGSVDGNTLEYTVSGLTTGKECFFRVSAENEVGISEPLEIDSAVIPKSPFGTSPEFEFGMYRLTYFNDACTKHSLKKTESLEKLEDYSCSCMYRMFDDWCEF